MITRDAAVVGAGPAGLAAAGMLADAGLSVLVIDEQPRPGGQILRQPPAGFRVPEWLPGRIYDELKACLDRVSAHPGVSWRLGATVLGMEPAATDGGGHSYELLLRAPAGMERIAAARVLVAAGCYDLPAPFPGWTLPGCMATGGLQSFLKGQQLLPGTRFVLAGTHPLQLIVAEQVLAAGGELAGLVFAQPRSRFLQMLRAPRAAWRGRGRLLHAARALARVLRAGVPITFSETVCAAEGDEALQAVRLAAVDAAGRIHRGRTRTLECDRLGTCFGFLACSELARQAGAEARWSEAGGGPVITADAWLRSSVPNLYVAGELTGVAGADAALLKGRLAAIGMLHDSGKLAPAAAARAAAGVRGELARELRFAGALQRLAAPPPGLLAQLQADDATLVCKCESISAGALRAALADHPHIGDVNALKLATRCGMGLCQGRYCLAAARRALAASAPAAAADPGLFNARLPVRPVPIGTFVSLAEADPSRASATQPPGD